MADYLDDDKAKKRTRTSAIHKLKTFVLDALFHFGDQRDYVTRNRNPLLETAAHAYIRLHDGTTHILNENS